MGHLVKKKKEEEVRKLGLTMFLRGFFTFV
jgi:hypothetical protein